MQKLIRLKRLGFNMSDIWECCPAYVNAGWMLDKCGLTEAETVLEWRHPDGIDQRKGPIHMNACKHDKCLFVKIYSTLNATNGG